MTDPTGNITPEKSKCTPKLSDKIRTRKKTTPTRAIIKPTRWTYSHTTTKTPTPLKKNNSDFTPTKDGVVLTTQTKTNKSEKRSVELTTQTKTNKSEKRSPVPVTKRPPPPPKTKIRVMPASRIKHFLKTDQPIATCPSHNVGTQLNLLIDSLDPMSENTIIKDYFKAIGKSNTLGNRFHFSRDAIYKELNIDDDVQRIEMLTTNPGNKPGSPGYKRGQDPGGPKPGGIAKKIDTALWSLRNTIGCNLRLQLKVNTSPYEMFNDTDGIYVVFLKVRWHPRDSNYIPAPPNEYREYIHIALYYGKEKLFIPGNRQGYGFKLTEENIKYYGNPINVLNDYQILNPRNKAQKLRGFYPIPNNGTESRRVSLGGIYLVMVEQPLIIDEISPLKVKATLSMRQGNNEREQNNNEVEVEETADTGAKGNENETSADKIEKSDNTTTISPTKTNQFATKNNNVVIIADSPKKQAATQTIDLTGSPKRKLAKVTQKPTKNQKNKKQKKDNQKQINTANSG